MLTYEQAKELLKKKLSEMTDEEKAQLHLAMRIVKRKMMSAPV